MKKLFSLLTALLFVGSMWADDPTVTLDFTSGGVAGDNVWGFPTASYITTAASYNNGTYTVNFGTSSNGHKAMFQAVKNSNDTIWKGFIMGKSEATLTLPTMSFNVNKIIVRGIAGASTKVTFNIFVGSSAVSTEVTSSVDDHEFAIAEASQAAGTVYVIKVTNGNNCQISSVEFYEAPTCGSEVSITKGVESHGTFTLSDTKVCADGDGGEITVSNIAPADGYRFKEITTSASGTPNNETKKVTGIKAATTITTVFEEIPAFTVTLMDDELHPLVEASAGAGVTLPSRDGCSGYTFAGWTASWNAEQSEWTATAPTIISAGAYAPTDNISLFPVYTKTDEGYGFLSYTKVTSAPSDWSGVYLFSTGTYTATGAYDSSNHLTATSYAPSTEEKTSYEFTLTKVADGMYSILLPDGETYLGYNSSTNFKTTTTAPTSSATAFLWNPSTSEIANVGTPARKLSTNGSNADIRPYENIPSGGAKICLYKRTEGASSVTYYISVPTCGATDIEEIVESSAKAVKVLRNGVLYIEKAGKTYNAQGQLVK